MKVIPVNLGIVYAYFVKGAGFSILVDCGFPGDKARLKAAMAANGIEREMLSLIVITHGDPDHYGAAGLLQKELGVPVLVHKADSESIATGKVRQMIPHNAMGVLVKVGALLLSALRRDRYQPFVPDIVMQEVHFSLQPYGIDGYLLHTPGETDGSISVILHDKQAIVGDLIGGLYPHSSIPGFSPFITSITDVKASLRAILATNPVTIYTGHSKPIDVKKHMGKLIKMAT